MVIKHGYKQTRVGVIPDDWNIFPLEVVSRKITDGEHWTPKRSTNGYYLLSARNIQNGRIDLAEVDYVDKAEYLRIRQRCNPDAGDVLISCSGTVGRIATVPPDFNCVMVRSVALVKPDPMRLSGLYAQYFLQSEAGQRQIFESVNQGAQPNLFQNHIQKLLIALPPSITEQRAIAAALSDVDSLIASLDALIAKKRLIKQGVMQELLTGKRRLPGFSGEWRKCFLAEIGSFTKGRGIKKDEIVDEGLPCIRYGEIYTHYENYVHEFISSIPLEVAKQSQRIERGDLLFTGSGETAEGIGKCVAFMGYEEAYAGGDIVIFKPKGQDSLFLGYLMNSPEVVSQKARMGQGDAVVHISSQKLGQLKIMLPDVKEQQAIAEILSDIDTEIHAIEQQRDKIRLIKQGMMQELLTGRTRIV